MKINTRGQSIAALGLILMLTPAVLMLTPAVLPAQAAPSAARLNTLGPENSQLARQVGTWDVTETIWASPGAAPVVTHAIAERRMIGSFLQEIIRSTPGSAESDIKRIDYLSFHRIEGRWKYVSMDTRDPVGIMSAESFGGAEAERIEIIFQPFAFPAAHEGARIVGQLLQMKELISQQDASHNRKDQYFVLADGRGKRWLAHRYAYTRRH